MAVKDTLSHQNVLSCASKFLYLVVPFPAGVDFCWNFDFYCQKLIILVNHYAGFCPYLISWFCFVNLDIHQIVIINNARLENVDIKKTHMMCNNCRWQVEPAILMSRLLLCVHGTYVASFVWTSTKNEWNAQNEETQSGQARLYLLSLSLVW